jgi:hypothetical protein
MSCPRPSAFEGLRQNSQPFFISRESKEAENEQKQ